MVPPAPSQLTQTEKQTQREKQKYYKNLQGLRKISFVMNVTSICNWFLSFCALTWASAVLLGAYVQQLSMWDFYDVSLLLFVEGIRFGLAATLRFLGYRLSDLCRWALRSIAFFLPLGIGGFAVLSMLPADVRLRIQLRFAGGHSSLLLSRHGLFPALSHTLDPAPPSSNSSYKSLFPSLKIFYVLVLLNAFILLLGTSIAGLMRLRYVRSSVKSLCKYHDKMMDSSTSWLHPVVDISFAFHVLGSQYKKGKDATYVCKHYADLIYYLYMHDKGVEVTEAALATENVYEKDAAANIVGFWAVLETFTTVKGCKLPLCFHKGMLSKLADIAAESYGSLGTAAARSFSLLLQLVDPELIGMVACVRAKSVDQDLATILLSRAAELLYPPWPPTYKQPSCLSSVLKEESHAHMYALWQYLSRQLEPTTNPFIEDQRDPLAKKIGEALPQLVKEMSKNVSSPDEIIESLVNKLGALLGPDQVELHDRYRKDIEGYLQAPPPPPSWKASRIKAIFLLLFNVSFPLACIGVGFIVNALL